MPALLSGKPGWRSLLWSSDMCLALPVKVIELGKNDLAIVDLGGVKKEISLALLDDVNIGDYVILHVGYALSVLDPDEAEKTLALFAELNQSQLGAP
jgi:hydrogenase expression/formation protein HypC